MLFRCVKIVLLTLLFAVGANAQSQLQRNYEACGKAEKATTEMNRMLERIYSEYKEDSLFIEKMKAAQTGWKNFYEAELQAEYPLIKDANPRIEYGSVYPMCLCVSEEILTRERIKQLKVWIDGTEEGDVCGGSVKIVERKAVVKRKAKSKLRKK